MNGTYEEYKTWLKDTPIDPNVERKYKAALELLAPRRVLEDRLSAQGSLLKGIDNCSGVALKAVRQLWSSIFSNDFSLFQLLQTILAIYGLPFTFLENRT